MFQSSLPVTGERVLAALFTRIWIAMFQSSLPVTGERVRNSVVVCVLNATFQSSLPVTGERVTDRPTWRSVDHGFNPRSPSPGSVSPSNGCSALAVTVSILAPRHRGACPDPRRCLHRPPGVSILAPRHRGACHRLHVSLRCRQPPFQSSLPVTGERVAFVICSASPSDSFNPRSPSPGSVSVAKPVLGLHQVRFNPRSPSPGSVSALRGFLQ